MEQADVLIQVLDARHLHRDLILTIQLLAYEKPLIAVLTHLSGPIEKIQKVLPVEYVFDAKKVSASLLADAITNSGIVDIRILLEWPIGYDDALLNAPQYLSVEKQLFHLVKNTTMDVIVHEAFFNTARTLLNRHGFLQKQVVKTMWLDRWVLSPLTGMGLFFTLMYTMFFVTIGIGGAVGELFSDIIEAVISLLPLTLYGVGASISAMSMAMCFAFVPILWIMYLFIGYMEHSGYLARVAVLADILMQPVGLSGHSFIPLLLGFGCNVPAVMSIRVVEGRTQRLLTALMVPFISCSARLSILVPIAATFSHIATALVMGLYLAGLILAFGVLYWLKKVLNVEHSASMSLSLPQYQWQFTD